MSIAAMAEVAEVVHHGLGASSEPVVQR